MKLTSKLDEKNNKLTVKVELNRLIADQKKEKINAQKVLNAVLEDKKLSGIQLTSIVKNDTIVSSRDEDVVGEWVFSVLVDKPKPKTSSGRKTAPSKSKSKTATTDEKDED